MMASPFGCSRVLVAVDLIACRVTAAESRVTDLGGVRVMSRVTRPISAPLANL